MCEQINSQLEIERENVKDEKAKIKRLEEENRDLKTRVSYKGTIVEASAMKITL
jgi:hypothetical protein